MHKLPPIRVASVRQRIYGQDSYHQQSFVQAVSGGIYLSGDKSPRNKTRSYLIARSPIKQGQDALSLNDKVSMDAWLIRFKTAKYVRQTLFAGW